jgi:hypothetical protein
LSFLANYTYAKNLTNAPDFRSPMDEAAIPQNNLDLNAEKGPGCDVRHRFALSSVFDIPAVRGTGWARLFTQNWHLSTIYQVQSGMPFTISVFGDTANSGTVLGENPIRANVTGQPVFGRVRILPPSGSTLQLSPRPRLLLMATLAGIPYTVRGSKAWTWPWRVRLVSPKEPDSSSAPKLSTRSTRPTWGHRTASSILRSSGRLRWR